MFNQEIILTSEECQSIIDMNNGFSPSKVIYNDAKGKTSNYRTSYDCWIRTSDTIRDLLLPKLSKYNITSLPPHFNILKYEIGQEFKKHRDSGLNEQTTKRIKTLIIQLSDNYKGGELVIWDDDKIICDTTIGNMILFPSKLLHQAKPVLEGIRYSMVYFLKPEHFNITKSII